MKLIIINGPNLNLLGKREPDIYGNSSFKDYYEKLVQGFPNVVIDYYQSNIEGEIIDKLQEVGFTVDGIILNAGGYTHTSVGISDAIAAIDSPTIEVHISNVYSREEYRHVSLLAKNSIGIIAGLGLDSYRLAVSHFLSLQE